MGKKIDKRVKKTSWKFSWKRSTNNKQKKTIKVRID